MRRLIETVVFVASGMATIGGGFSRAESAEPAAASFTAPPSLPVGPTPYPKAEKDWPGVGAIRVFPFMTDNRMSFWRDRERRQGSVVFVGDSLIGGWRTLAQDLPGVPVANRGIGGECTRVLLFRFKEDVLDLHPRAIVMLTGSNDLSALQDVQQTRRNLLDLLAMAERLSPGVPIILCTLPPRDNPKAPVDPRQTAALNKIIASMAEGHANVRVLDLHAQLVDPDGSLHVEYFASDKQHLSSAGFTRFREALVPLLKQLKIG